LKQVFIIRFNEFSYVNARQNLFQSKYEDEADFQDSGGMQGRITRARKLMSQKQWIPSAIK
jgi:hypothetical protein